MKIEEKKLPRPKLIFKEKISLGSISFVPSPRSVQSYSSEKNGSQIIKDLQKAIKSGSFGSM